MRYLLVYRIGSTDERWTQSFRAFSQIVPVLVLATVPRYDERGNVCPSETAGEHVDTSMIFTEATISQREQQIVDITPITHHVE